MIIISGCLKPSFFVSFFSLDWSLFSWGSIWRCDLALYIVYVSRIMREMIASGMVKTPSRVVRKMRIVLARRMGRSFLMISLSTLMPRPTMAVMANTKRMLAMLEPTTLFITILDSFFSTEDTEVATSGSEVPRAMIVTPIINGDILKCSPIFSAASVK